MAIQTHSEMGEDRHIRMHGGMVDDKGPVSGWLS